MLLPAKINEMKYKNVTEGKFISRPNRFTAEVEIDGQATLCHVKNTGRCRELLLPGRTVFLEPSDNPARKTRYDLIAVETPEQIVSMDSQAPNAIVREWLEEGGLYPGLEEIRQEVVYGESRFDFCLKKNGRPIYMEVKGVNLKVGDTARFPDAPTLRGVKHIYELCRAKEEGYGAVILFAVKLKGVSALEPNDETQPEFGLALRHAQECGVEILAYDCVVTRDSIRLDRPLPVRLG